MGYVTFMNILMLKYLAMCCSYRGEKADAFKRIRCLEKAF